MRVNELVSHGIPVTQAWVETEQDVKDLGREPGLYITIETGPLNRLVDFKSVCACLTDQLRPLLEPYFGKPLCICGIGNQDMPSDCLGPETARRVQPQMYNVFSPKSNFEKIGVICPGTMGQTNLTTETIISGVASAMGAACVLAVDSCVARDAKRLCATIQLSDSGIVNHNRTANLTQATVGIPVIAIVVPTVICMESPPGDSDMEQQLLLAPIHIEESISIASFIIACAIALAAHPELDYESCKQYIEYILHSVI